MNTATKDPRERKAELLAELKTLRIPTKTKRPPLLSVIGGVIQLEREERRMGLSHLAFQSGVSVGFLSMLESGANPNPTLDSITALSVKGLGIPLSALFARWEKIQSQQNK